MGTAVRNALRDGTVSMDVRVVRGETAILAQASALEELALRCGQPGAMSWLGYFLHSLGTARKRPVLVQVVERRTAGVLRNEDVCGAALLSEYCILGRGTGAFATDDMAGFRSIIAPKGQRARVAALAAGALLRSGAHQVLVTYAECGASAVTLEPGRPAEFAGRVRVVENTLVLEQTFEQTLARMGKTTRRNLRYYRKRLMEAGAEFVADARGMVSEDELAELNEGSLNPVPAGKMLLQHASACDLPGSFLMGVRDAQGRWLTLAGGWRQGGQTVLHWQMNVAGMEKESLCTVMRSLLIEHEVLRGTRSIVFFGGTTHPMYHSFRRDEVADLLLRSRSLQGMVLRFAAWVMAKRAGGNGHANFFARSFCAPELEWRRVKTAKVENRRTPARTFALTARCTEAFSRQK